MESGHVDHRPLHELPSPEMVCNFCLVFLGFQTILLLSQTYVAIDFENIANIKDNLSMNLDSQVSLAILDTRDLTSSWPDKLVSKYNFATGSLSYCQKATRKFLFRKTTIISQKDMLMNIESCIPQTCNIVLVGHDIRHDLHALSTLKFDF